MQFIQSDIVIGNAINMLEAEKPPLMDKKLFKKVRSYFSKYLDLPPIVHSTGEVQEIARPFDIEAVSEILHLQGLKEEEEIKVYLEAPLLILDNNMPLLYCGNQTKAPLIKLLRDGYEKFAQDKLRNKLHGERHSELQRAQRNNG